jgi:hypothetical protein
LFTLFVDTYYSVLAATEADFLGVFNGVDAVTALDTLFH